MSTIELKPNVIDTKFVDFVKPKISPKEALKALKPIKMPEIKIKEPTKDLNLVLDDKSLRNRMKVKDDKKSFLKKIIT